MNGMLLRRSTASMMRASRALIISAIIFETLGAINVEGEEVLKQLFRFAAKALRSRVYLVLWESMGTSVVQRSISQAIITRIDGREFEV